MPRDSSEAAQGVMTISAATQRCRLSLTQCLQIPLLMEREWAENKLADFNLWASGIGAAAEHGDKISLDSRLNGKPALFDVFLRLLEMLLTCLEECQSLSASVSVTASVEHPYWEARKAQQASIRDDRGRPRTSGPHQGSTASRSISPWSDQSSAASEPDITSPSKNGRMVDAMVGVDSVIGQLNDLGVAVRRAGKQQRLQKADSRLDISEHSDLGAFLRFWIQIQKRKHPDTAVGVHDHLTPIQLRLINVNLLRRNRFIYAQTHAQYLLARAEVQQGSLPLLDESKGSLAQSSEDKGGHSHTVPTGQLAGPSPDLLGQKGEPVKDVEARADASTATKLETATEILEKRLQGSESQMTSTAAKIRYPYPPRIRPGVKFFRCPCCCQTLDRAIAEGHRWRRHLAEDICPYTCIYDNCPSPETTFVTRRAWIDHMEGEEHSVSEGWFCLICEASTEYRTESDLSTHYMKDHAELITANQMQTLLDSSLLTFSTTPICCPLCDPGEEDPLERRPPDWDHIAEHVHEFALLSLPWGAADPVVQPQTPHKACERVSSWLGSNARPTDSTSEVHAQQIGLPNIGNLYFNEEPYFAESRGMRTETSIASTETDQGSERPGSTSPLLFPENDTAIGSGTNLLETVDAFLQIPPADWVVCERFLARHPEIIVLADRDEILNQAWKALEHADSARSKACIERLVLIETCRNLTPEGQEHMFTALEQPESAESRDFYAACEQEEETLRSRTGRAHASGRSSPAIRQPSSESASRAKEQDQFGAAISDEPKNDQKESESRATASTPRWLKKNEKDRGEPVLDPTQSGKEHPLNNSRSRFRQHVSTSGHIQLSVVDLTPMYPLSRGNFSAEAVTERIYVVAEYPADTCVSCFWHVVMQTPGSGAVVVTLGEPEEDRRVRCFPMDMQQPLLILPDFADVSEADQGGQIPVLPEVEAASHGNVRHNLMTRTEELTFTIGSEPPEDRANEHSRYVTLELLSLHHESSMNYEVRTLELTIDDQSKRVRHYLWPDAQITKPGDRVALLELMKASRAAAGDSPGVVCYNTNVGLANTWVALDFLREELEAGSFIISSRQKGTLPGGAADISNPNNDDLIWTTVGRMHEQGTMMDMNESEYKFLYETLRDEFSKLYAEPGEDPSAIAETSGAESRAHDTPRAHELALSSYPDDADSGRNAEYRPDNTVSNRSDPRYYVHNVNAFFVPGRVFSIILHEPSGAQSISKKTGSIQGNVVDGLNGHVRRMIICRQRQGYSLCVPISSYDGKGVAAKPPSYQQQQAHAIVYPRGQRAPERLPGEPRFEKMPIAVDLRPDRDLAESSRINFRKCHTVKHNVKVMDIGRVAAESMANFERYVREELLR
ncbi:hypothetical protein LTR92_000923 [Exophiala xenobiotica]|nr:hypothetical protein LTR92_000923 [Exophiala xenobiotica]